MELMNCPGLAVPHEVMHHVVRVESSFNPYAIGVVGGRLVRQPKNLPEAIATVRMLERRGYNFSLGVAQVNRYNLGKYGLDSYEKAFEACPNLQAGSRILAECYSRSNNDWGKSFSCYYSGNFVTGFRHGYVQKVYASINRAASNDSDGQAIAVIGKSPAAGTTVAAAAKPVYAPGRQSGPQRLAAALATSQPAPPPPPMAASMPQLPLSATPMPISSPSAVQPVSMGMAALVPQASQPVRVMPMNAAAGPAAAAALSKEPSPGDQAFVF
ncbi:lytic transglycosylase domain-containing protein [Lysobacter sp. CA196]|uniref:lytic transglycosylase domain-containing protein n=1 Tax=Lysobacter sp. CA196 TaxID=3455606 RepID=UPI003F8D4C4C